jgi:hypothetical protein
MMNPHQCARWVEDRAAPQTSATLSELTAGQVR